MILIGQFNDLPCSSRHALVHVVGFSFIVYPE